MHVNSAVCNPHVGRPCFTWSHFKLVKYTHISPLVATQVVHPNTHRVHRGARFGTAHLSWFPRFPSPSLWTCISLPSPVTPRPQFLGSTEEKGESLNSGFPLGVLAEKTQIFHTSPILWACTIYQVAITSFCSFRQVCVLPRRKKQGRRKTHPVTYVDSSS